MWLTRELVAEGYRHRDLARRTRSGQLRHVRRGVYDMDEVDDPAVRHARLLAATVRLAAPQVVDLDDLRVTSLARTVADVGRTVPFDQAVRLATRLADEE